MAGVIQKIRNKAGLAVGLIGLSLLIFILTDLLQSNQFFQELIWGRSDVVARIGNVELKYAEYSKLYERSVRNQAPEDPLAQEQLKNALWQQLLSDKLYEIETEPWEMNVSPEEIADMLYGERPHPIVMQIFSQGEQIYERERVRQIIQQASNDPQLSAQLRELEDYLIKVRLREKYEALLKATAYVPTSLAAYQNRLDNTDMDFNFLAINYSAIADSLVPVSESELKRYYADHKEEFRLREPERVLRYVVFYKEPSAEDTLEALTRAQELREAFQNATDNYAFAAANSDIPPDSTLKRWSDLSKVLQDSIQAVGQVIGPYAHPSGFAVAKVDTIVRDTQPLYQVRHLMIMKGLDSVAARKKADSLYRVIRPDNFAELVNQFSEDWQTRFASGELGWYGPEGRFGKAFYEALKKAPIGKITGVIASEQGYHIVEVRSREDRRVRVYEIVKEVVPSSKTISAIRQKAQQMALHAEKDFDGAAQAAGQNIRISPALRPSSSSLPGIYGISELLRWAFSQKKPGAFSGVVELENAFVVAQIVKADEPPYRSWEAVRDLIEPKVRNQKKAQLIRQRLEGKGNSLDELKAAFGPGAYTSRSQNALYGSVAVPGLGLEPKVLGVAAALKENALSPLIEGTNGVYKLQLTRKTIPPEATPDMAKSYSAGQSATLSNQLIQRFQNAMTERLEVKDYRYRFGF
ncbi:MAG: peptidylprolyl isomerase [Bacteroidota bacterium]|nr:peptidylprolyl isomerase [Bacteroidota bacterium]